MFLENNKKDFDNYDKMNNDKYCLVMTIIKSLKQLS